MPFRPILPRPLPRLLALVMVALATACSPARAQTSEHDEVSIRHVADVPSSFGQQAVRLVRDRAGEALYLLTSIGHIYRIDLAGENAFQPVLLLTSAAHGTPIPAEQPSAGMDIGPDGTIYLLGNENVGTNTTRAIIRRGVPTGDTYAWSTVAVTEPYRLSHTWFDHRFSGLVLSPDGQTLYANSGSRTDHGEMYDGIREEGLTAAIFQIPADGEDLTLPNDREALRAQGYVFAEGIRNTFDMAFAPNGELFGTENGGDRDDSEEFNWLREGHHYGFPWRIGTNDTPMQFEGYDPDDDACVQQGRNPDNQADTGWYFSNDPTYPEPPPGVFFTDPIPSYGPDADHYRDCETGEVFDASEQGVSIGSFTSHRSPLGLVFDQDSVLAEPFRGGAFVLSWNSSDDMMLQRLNDVGEDLLFVDLAPAKGGYTMHTTRIAGDFNHPIDAAMVGNKIYVVEHGPQGGWPPSGPYSIFEVTLPAAETSTAEEAPAVATLAAAYPNPFREQATLQYTLQRPAHVTAVLYDVLGREVATLVDGWQSAGQHTTAIHGGRLPGGLYVCKLTAAGDVHTLTLVRVP